MRPDEITQLEKAWHDHEMAGQMGWFAYQNTQTEYVFHNQKLVIFDLNKDQPLIYDVVQVRGLNITWGNGLSLTLASGRGNPPIYVTNRPRAAVPGVYLWLPSNSEIQHRPACKTLPLSGRHARVALKIKTATTEPNDDARYVLTVKEFRSIWPDLLKGF